MKEHLNFEADNKKFFIITAAIEIIIFLVGLFCILYFDDKTIPLIIYCAAFIILQAAVSLYYFQSKKKRDENEIKPMLNNITTDFIQELHLPVIISNHAGNIIWYNDNFQKRFDFISVESALNRRTPLRGEIYNRHISSIVGSQISYEMIRSKENYLSAEFEYEGQHFFIEVYKIKSNGNDIDILIFHDRTEINSLTEELRMSRPVVGYFIIDNLSELAQNMQDKYREASGKVSDFLKSWAHQNGGVIKEYEKDKYLCIFENRALKSFVKNKFSILDDIRNINIEDMGQVTLSGGISGTDGTMSEKESVARRALDLALQRGGDQVVVKGANSDEFYGGKTKTVQKKTKIRSRVVANNLISTIKKSDNILIMGHKFADNDSIGACIGIARLAVSLGAKTNIIVNIHDKNLKSTFMKLRGLNEYKNIFIDSVTANDMITSGTFLIIADVNNPLYFEAEEIFKIVNTVAVIDHHIKTAEFSSEPEIVYIEPSASSTCELVTEILEHSLAPGELLKEEAELLLAGIILDTNRFLRNTGTRTFSAALYLRGEGGNPSEAVSIFKTGLDEFTREAKFESNVSIYRNCVAIAVLQAEATDGDKTAGAKAADKMLSIDGVVASFAMFKAGDTVHISARSLGTVNVQLILEAMGGGGHYDVAGAQIKNMPVKDVLNLLKKTLDEYLDGV